MPLHLMQRRGFNLPINLHNKALVLKTDLFGEIKEVIYNGFSDIDVFKDSPLVGVFSSDSHKAYYDIFSNLKHNCIMGFSSTLINQEQVSSFVIKNSRFIIYFGLPITKELRELLNELVVLTSKQTSKLRELYQTSINQNDDTDLYLEMMKINNELINVRRTLDVKNRALSNLNDELNKQLDHDQLTKAYNRRRFFKDIYEFVKKGPHVLVMVDFNNFKIINDTFGHKKGDFTLIEFTEKINQYIRNKQASLYRLGGDEFAILAHKDVQLNFKEMFDKVERHLKQIHSKIGLAFGVVDIDGSTVNQDNPAEDSMNKADQKMYVMKRAFHKKNTA
jgi:diguanylate cyclase (GGDEF)-like protein